MFEVMQTSNDPTNARIWRVLLENYSEKYKISANSYNVRMVILTEIDWGLYNFGHCKLEHRTDYTFVLFILLEYYSLEY